MFKVRFPQPGALQILDPSSYLPQPAGSKYDGERSPNSLEGTRWGSVVETKSASPSKKCYWSIDHFRLQVKDWRMIFSEHAMQEYAVANLLVHRKLRQKDSRHGVFNTYTKRSSPACNNIEMDCHITEKNPKPLNLCFR